MRKILLAISLLAVVGCSGGGGSGKKETGFNFDGSWTGDGSLTSKNLGIQECPAIMLDFQQTASELRVNVIKWICEKATRSNGRTMIFEIDNGNLYFEGKWVGTISQKKIIAEIKTSTTSKYEILFDSDNNLVIFQETMKIGQDTWNILGLLKKE